MSFLGLGVEVVKYCMEYPELKKCIPPLLGTGVLLVVPLLYDCGVHNNVRERGWDAEVKLIGARGRCSSCLLCFVFVFGILKVKYSYHDAVMSLEATTRACGCLPGGGGRSEQINWLRSLRMARLSTCCLHSMRSGD